MSDARLRRAERIQTPYLVAEDELDRSLRPRRLEEFVGQEALREQLAVAIEAAARARRGARPSAARRARPGSARPRWRRSSPPSSTCRSCRPPGPALERKGDIAAFLTALEPRSVFFVDEIHRLPRTLEETFYPAMEDHRLPITVGQGAGARVVTLELPPFTLVGATTRTGLLTTPLRDRFGIQARLEPYATEELAAIVAPLGGDPRDRARGGRGAARSRRAAAARRAWPTACSSACATTPRCAWRASSRADAARRGAGAARGRRARASTASTARSCARSA